MFERLLALIGAPVVSLYGAIIAAGEFSLFYARLFPQFFLPPYRMVLVFRQIETIGIGSMGVIFLTALFTGMVEAIQFYNGFKEFGAENFMGYTIFISISKELGPVLTSLMVISRAISAMAAELGTMRVTEQIDAIDILAIDSRRYLIVPRVIATAISLPLLIALFDVVAIGGAFVISTQFLGVNPVAYQEVIYQFLEWTDIASGIIKGFFIGIIVGMIGAYVGYFTHGGARGVGLATTKAVVLAAISIFVVNYFLSALFLFLGW
ncbi:MAG: ABC transporter permease [Sulfuricurvum sp. PC08-66]|nr:MAG: ABC transporter permease [Sulfuricurvum sp. PC08-66]